VVLQGLIGFYHNGFFCHPQYYLNITAGLRNLLKIDRISRLLRTDVAVAYIYIRSIDTPDSFLNDSIRLSELAVQGLSLLFKVSSIHNFEYKDPTHGGIWV
jgi:hypothetical protein